MFFWKFYPSFLFSIVLLYPLIAQGQIPPLQEIQGLSGGNKNSGDCGYISNEPNYVLNLTEQVYSLKIVVEATQGKPSLLVLGPGESDRFCILGEAQKGKYPKMGGVWEKGKYLIYVGDAQGNQYPFTMKITTK